MTTTTATRSSPQPSASEVGRHDRLFYGGMATALAVTVFAGFAPTYYLRLLSGGPELTLTGGPFTALVHVHATKTHNRIGKIMNLRVTHMKVALLKLSLASIFKRAYVVGVGRSARPFVTSYQIRDASFAF
jgi:hypothetical protein